MSSSGPHPFSANDCSGCFNNWLTPPPCQPPLPTKTRRAVRSNAGISTAGAFGFGMTVQWLKCASLSWRNAADNNRFPKQSTPEAFASGVQWLVWLGPVRASPWAGYMPISPWEWLCGSAPASSFGMSAMRHSVVSRRPLMEAAFCRAERVTLVGSTTPAFTRSS